MIAWGSVTAQPASIQSAGVDFELRFHESYPLYCVEDRPVICRSTLSEGVP